MGECTGKIAILLDDHDVTIAHIAAPGEARMTRSISLRRLVEDDRAGLGDEHASDGNLLLLAAG